MTVCSSFDDFLAFFQKRAGGFCRYNGFSRHDCRQFRDHLFSDTLSAVGRVDGQMADGDTVPVEFNADQADKIFSGLPEIKLALVVCLVSGNRLLQFIHIFLAGHEGQEAHRDFFK